MAGWGQGNCCLPALSPTTTLIPSNPFHLAPAGLSCAYFPESHLVLQDKAEGLGGLPTGPRNYGAEGWESRGLPLGDGDPRLGCGPFPEAVWSREAGLAEYPSPPELGHLLSRHSGACSVGIWEGSRELTSLTQGPQKGTPEQRGDLGHHPSNQFPEQTCNQEGQHNLGPLGHAPQLMFRGSKQLHPAHELPPGAPLQPAQSRGRGSLAGGGGSGGRWVTCSGQKPHPQLPTVSLG